MIVLFTDFGPYGPYRGQMEAVLRQQAPGVPVVDLINNAPRFDPRASAYLLAAHAGDFPVGTVFLCVVDPGVGGARAPLVAEIDGRFFVGPDNGLFNVLALRGATVCWHEVRWRPAALSASFHGRDLFAPVAAALARGEPPDAEPIDWRTRVDDSWTADAARVIYIDHFGNAMTGQRAATVSGAADLLIRGRALPRAHTFSDVAVGRCFWYENANGLVEIAANRASAAATLGISLGDTYEWKVP